MTATGKADETNEIAAPSPETDESPGQTDERIIPDELITFYLRVHPELREDPERLRQLLPPISKRKKKLNNLLKKKIKNNQNKGRREALFL